MNLLASQLTIADFWATAFESPVMRISLVAAGILLLAVLAVMILIARVSRPRRVVAPDHGL